MSSMINGGITNAQQFNRNAVAFSGTPMVTATGGDSVKFQGKSAQSAQRSNFIFGGIGELIIAAGAIYLGCRFFKGKGAQVAAEGATAGGGIFSKEGMIGKCFNFFCGKEGTLGKYIHQYLVEPVANLFNKLRGNTTPAPTSVETAATEAVERAVAGKSTNPLEVVKELIDQATIVVAK